MIPGNLSGMWSLHPHQMELSGGRGRRPNRQMKTITAATMTISFMPSSPMPIRHDAAGGLEMQAVLQRAAARRLTISLSRAAPRCTSLGHRYCHAPLGDSIGRSPCPSKAYSSRGGARARRGQFLVQILSKPSGPECGQPLESQRRGGSRTPKGQSPGGRPVPRGSVCSGPLFGSLFRYSGRAMAASPLLSWIMTYCLPSCAQLDMP